jgi:hypothetical protein
MEVLAEELAELDQIFGVDDRLDLRRGRRPFFPADQFLKGRGKGKGLTLTANPAEAKNP